MGAFYNQGWDLAPMFTVSNKKKKNSGSTLHPIDFILGGKKNHIPKGYVYSSPRTKL